MKYFVLYSTKSSRRRGQVSLLGLVETLCATGFGLWIALKHDYFTLLASSLILTVFVHLRSARSVKLAAIKLAQYSNHTHYLSLDLVAVFLGVGFLTLIWVNFSWIGFAWLIVAALLFAAIMLLSNRMMRLAPKGISDTISEYIEAVLRSLFRIFSIPISFGFAINLLIKATTARFCATIYYLGDGIRMMPVNWANLVLRTDVLTPPEILPDLKDFHPLNFHNLRGAKGSIPGFGRLGRTSVLVMLAVLFIPSVLYRFLLKSSFWMYFPLLWLASSPSEFRLKNGSLVWDEARGRSLFDWFSLSAAILSISIVVAKTWNSNRGVYSESWLYNRNLPNYFPAQILGLDPNKIGGWDLLPFFAAALSIVVLLWANSLNTRIKYRRAYLPSQIEIRILYVLVKLRNAITILIIGLGLASVLYFLYYHCRLPEVLQSIIGVALGPMQSCLAASGPLL